MIDNAKEKSLRSQEERYRLAARATQDAIWDWDLVTDEVEWGDAACGALGFQADKPPTDSGWWKDRLHADDQPRILESLSAAIKGNTSAWAGRYRFLLGDGTYADILDRGFLIRDERGKVSRIVGAMHNVTKQQAAQAALTASQETLRQASKIAKLGVWGFDALSAERTWSPEMWAILGLPETKPTREIFSGCVHPEDRELVRQQLEGELAPGGSGSAEAEFRIIRKSDGAERWVFANGRSLLDAEGSQTNVVGTIKDITDQRQAEQDLAEREERLRLAVETTGIGIFDIDISTGQRRWTAEMRNILGVGEHERITPGSFLRLVHEQDREVVAQFYNLETAEGFVRSAVFRILRADSHEERWVSAASRVFRDAKGSPVRKLGTVEDITERMMAESKIRYAATHDALTDLPNRLLFQTLFETALAQASATGRSASLLLVDLDELKDVNDTLGHDAGDALLRETADRLRAGVRDCDTVARVGGDEFAVIIIEPFTLQQSARFAEHLVETLRQPFAFQGRLISSRASIGVAAFPDHDATVPELMKDADIALTQAKTGGRNRVAAYEPQMRVAMERRVALSAELRVALTERQIIPFYQPKIDLASGRVVGFEALARWQHPTMGVLTPGYFGIVFEDPELAELIGDTMVQRVAADIRSWIASGLEIGRVAINLSSAEFSHPDLADHLLERLEDEDVPPSRVEVEVTETVFLGASSKLVAATLHRLREVGVTIALDDFGTGFASLTHLKQFPVDHIKIDQSFIRGLTTSLHDQAIVRAVISLGRSFGMQVTAEGVETQNQVNYLQEMGCDFGQGYFYSKPMIGTRVPSFLKRACFSQPDINQDFSIQTAV